MSRYQEFHRRSIEDRDGFWREQAGLIDWQTPFTQVCDYSKPPFVNWFVGGRTNLCHNAVDRHLQDRPDQKALIWVSTEVDQEVVYSFRQLHAEVQRMAAVLLALGVQQGDRVLIYMPMTAEAAFAMLACARIGAIHSVVFGGFASHSLATRIDDAEPTVIVSTDAGSRSGKVVPYKPLLDEAINLARHKPAKVLMIDRGLAPFARSAGRDEDYAVLREQQLDTVVPCVWLESSDPSYTLYTSGTTGKPKGVELTHHNALSQQVAIAALWDVSEHDVFLSYLPWHHCFGALFERLMALWNRALLVVDDSRGRDLDRLFANWFEIRPTVYFGVPRVYNGMMDRARRDPQALSALKSLRFAFSAAAPISEPAFRFFEELGVPVLEGWGLTETSPCATITRRTDPKRAPGVVGFPLPGTQVKLDPVPEFPGRGEILVRGPQVMRGYHHRPDETLRVLQDRWLRCGDLGEWTSHGLKLLGRLDGVFKLENGEKVSAGEVEARLLAATPLLEQAVVLGQSQTFVTALCWISPAAAQRFLQDLGLEPPETVEELVQIPELRRAIVEALQSANHFASVGYERVRRIALVEETPSLDTGELTPTLKMVRAVATGRHAHLISALREEQAHAQVLEILRRGDAFQHA